MNFFRLINKSSLLYYRFKYLHTTNIYFGKLVNFKLSDIGEGIAEVQLKEWHVKVGDYVNEFDEICSVQSDKALVTITSRYKGIINKLYFQPDDIAKVGEILLDVELSEENNKNNIISEEYLLLENKEKENIKENNSLKILASPAVRRLINEYKINLSEIKGTGQNGRILKEDILKIIGEENKINNNNNKITKIPLRGYTRSMFKTMTESLTIPHFVYGDEFSIEELIKTKELFNKQKINNLGYLPFFIKIISIALFDFPILNSSLDLINENIILKNFHNISLAIDTPNGLAVPNIKNCENKNILEIAKELNELKEKGKKGMFLPNDILNGTFTISNIGSIGGIFMSPIIFPPQVAIGAIGKFRNIIEDNLNENKLKNKRIVNICWAADHRIIDGATLARFSNRVKQLIENPQIISITSFTN
ncbi:Dihydrolipoamide acetyltransferase component of pyruvate dehydrogenase complex [Meloidogyne graminicola]|uniref:Dihydrolipoamide acetyltransferase component of pyruvate dehydrogenase complex n=1 Tax=Meloidogyne graminicola TaxID=189291 RepID=A0A8S9Z6W8_9BILA|nr:Dihydrolipoamide acetyltransferase component of pyruvate dehydrogenase complex [Meloidogyne graminicola]